MENKKGSGIFLGVVSVATLVVAIIGATFAYFSASVSSNEGAIGATAYEFDVKVTNIKMIQPERSQHERIASIQQPRLRRSQNHGRERRGAVLRKRCGKGTWLQPSQRRNRSALQGYGETQYPHQRENSGHQFYP